jgi:hypothetical protein
MNALLTSLFNDVILLTNRPDLVGETLLAIRTATIKAHSSDYFYKDIFETGVMFDTSVAQQSLDYKTLVPKWRALKYLRTYDASTTPGSPGDFVEIITPEQVLDSYSASREGVCYVAGQSLQIRTRAAHQYYLIGCYIYPDTGTETFSSWVAEEQSAAIVYEAAATIFKTIGYDEQFAAYQGLVAAQYAELKITNIIANGY